MRKLLIFFSLFVFAFVDLSKAEEIKILYKLENEIITNQDVIEELKHRYHDEEFYITIHSKIKCFA